MKKTNAWTLEVVGEWEHLVYTILETLESFFNEIEFSELEEELRRYMETPKFKSFLVDKEKVCSYQIKINVKSGANSQRDIYLNGSYQRGTRSPELTADLAKAFLMIKGCFVVVDHAAKQNSPRLITQNECKDVFEKLMQEFNHAKKDKFKGDKSKFFSRVLEAYEFYNLGVLPSYAVERQYVLRGYQLLKLERSSNKKY